MSDAEHMKLFSESVELWIVTHVQVVRFVFLLQLRDWQTWLAKCAEIKVLANTTEYSHVMVRALKMHFYKLIPCPTNDRHFSSRAHNVKTSRNAYNFYDQLLGFVQYGIALRKFSSQLSSSCASDSHVIIDFSEVPQQKFAEPSWEKFAEPSREKFVRQIKFLI